MHEQTYTSDVWGCSFRKEPLPLQIFQRILAANAWRVALSVKYLMAAEISHQKDSLYILPSEGAEIRTLHTGKGGAFILTC